MAGKTLKDYKLIVQTALNAVVDMKNDELRYVAFAAILEHLLKAEATP